MGRGHVTSDNWQGAALCRGADPDLFMPLVETDHGLAATRGRYCDHCPVRPKCLQEALESGSEGYWGGTSTAMRRAISRSRTRAKCPVCLGTDLVVITSYEICGRCGSSWPNGSRPEPEREDAS